jgi:hypothetical protein
MAGVVHVFTDLDRILALPPANIQQINGTYWGAVQRTHQSAEEAEHPVLHNAITWEYSPSVNMAHHAVINLLLTKCKASPKHLVHKFDSIWVASDPVQGHGGIMKRVVLAQSSNDHNHLRVLEYFPDHWGNFGSNPTDPYLVKLDNLTRRWLSVEPRYALFYEN